jgi:hypothetical protein
MALRRSNYSIAAMPHYGMFTHNPLADGRSVTNTRQRSGVRPADLAMPWAGKAGVALRPNGAGPHMPTVRPRAEKLLNIALRGSADAGLGGVVSGWYPATSEMSAFGR